MAMTDAPPVSIQEVSRRSGLSKPTPRYCEKIDLIGPAHCACCGRRVTTASGAWC
ncbi:hypothetical protein ACH5AL_25020 [Actinacidiphila glaucinigra]|uniref:hypothetical protein n=1 Tax=Actinacidiphila glaucinigra TaxID=235986 RepID=UPI0037953E95